MSGVPGQRTMPDCQPCKGTGKVSDTPLTVEILLAALEGAVTVAGFNGTCERVVKYDQFVSALRKLV